MELQGYGLHFNIQNNILVLLDLYKWYEKK